jgi:hypothetical protein
VNPQPNPIIGTPASNVLAPPVAGRGYAMDILKQFDGKINGVHETLHRLIINTLLFMGWGKYN